MKRYRTTCFAILYALFLAETTVNAQDANADRIARAREEERAQNLIARRVASANPNGAVVSGGAWWTDSRIVTELGLTEDQKFKISRAFENHSRNIVNSSGFLEKEEMQLARLLEADSIDHVAVLSQINRVVQSRGEVERETAAMTLEMREQLTRTQWTKLQAMGSQNLVNRIRVQTAPAPSTTEPSRK